MSIPSSLHRLATQHFDERYKGKQNVVFDPARTHHLGLMAQNFENLIFTFRCFSLKAINNYVKLQRLVEVAKFLLMYFFTHTYIVFLFMHLPTEIVIFKNVCCQMKCSSGDSFSFFSSRCC